MLVTQAHGRIPSSRLSLATQQIWCNTELPKILSQNKALRNKWKSTWCQGEEGDKEPSVVLSETASWGEAVPATSKEEEPTIWTLERTPGPSECYQEASLSDRKRHQGQWAGSVGKGDLSSIPGSHMVQGKIWLQQVVLRLLHACCAISMHTRVNVIKNKLWIKRERNHKHILPNRA